MRKEENTEFVAGWQPTSLSGLLKRRRRQYLTITVMSLSADDALGFHLLDNTRRTVIADPELTLNAGNRCFTLLG
ncbi:Uncharacterised protein [Salmonella enterica subsp. arizonae]|nr:Uncharacterised protein [Salmonella enterica subsp. arizonae]